MFSDVTTLFEPGTFYYEENDEQRQIDYIVENIDIDEKGVCRNPRRYPHDVARLHVERKFRRPDLDMDILL